ncbi:MAG TPA: iron-containing alcohol dehydrogenase [Bacteroidales bacterium]|nr:iron-containing alcohol dehydrogenase [Bacteroidales bacterium]
MAENTNIQLELRKFVAPEFIFGLDARMLAGRYVKKLGAKKVLVVTDAGIHTAGWANDVLETLDDEKLSYQIFSEVSPNPRSAEVMKGAEVYKNSNCDAIVAIGGGSVMDCAKGIGIVSSNDKNILQYEGVDKVDIPIPPLVCIPTTAGTSADVSQFAIINNEHDKVKIAIISKAVVPDVALIDPAVLVTMDSYLTACTGMDALVHAIEAFVSTASSPFTDLNALEAIRLINENLVSSINLPNDYELRGKVMLGSLYAGLAFSNASLGCVHAMAHSLGGFLDLPHGECNAILLPHVMSYNFESATAKFAKIGEVLGLEMKGLLMNEKRKMLIEHIMQLKTKTGILKTLRERGVGSSDIPLLASKAIKDPCQITNPRTPSKEDIEVIYSEAM